VQRNSSQSSNSIRKSLKSTRQVHIIRLHRRHTGHRCSLLLQMLHSACSVCYVQQWAVQKWPNQLRCCLGWRLYKELFIRQGLRSPPQVRTLLKKDDGILPQAADQCSDWSAADVMTHCPAAMQPVPKLQGEVYINNFTHYWKNVHIYYDSQVYPAKTLRLSELIFNIPLDTK